MKYRKRPVVIEAWLVYNLLGHGSNAMLAMPQVILDAVKDEKLSFHPDNISVHTLEGIMEAEIGDYLIRGIKGEFYPCKSDIFHLTYEPAE